MQTEQIESRPILSEDELIIKARMQNFFVQAANSCRQAILDSNLDKEIVEYVVKLIDDDIAATYAL